MVRRPWNVPRRKLPQPPTTSTWSLDDDLPQLQQTMLSMFTDPALSDVSLVVEGVDVPAHKAILAAWSRPFRAMFTLPMRESRHNCRVVIEDAEHKHLLVMLEYMYSARVSLDDQNVMPVSALANRYDVAPLITQCEGYMKWRLNPSNVCRHLLAAEDHQCASMAAFALDYLAVHFDEVHHDNSSDFNALAPDIVLRVLQHEGLTVDEETVFLAVDGWARAWRRRREVEKAAEVVRANARAQCVVESGETTQIISPASAKSDHLSEKTEAESTCDGSAKGGRRLGGSECAAEQQGITGSHGVRALKADVLASAAERRRCRAAQSEETACVADNGEESTVLVIHSAAGERTLEIGGVTSANESCLTMRLSRDCTERAASRSRSVIDASKGVDVVEVRSHADTDVACRSDLPNICDAQCHATIRRTSLLVDERPAPVIISARAGLRGRSRSRGHSVASMTTSNCGQDGIADLHEGQRPTGEGSGVAAGRGMSSSLPPPSPSPLRLETVDTVDTNGKKEAAALGRQTPPTSASASAVKNHDQSGEQDDVEDLPEEERSHIDQFFEEIRFPLMSVSFLCQVVERSASVRVSKVAHSLLHEAYRFKMLDLEGQDVDEHFPGNHRIKYRGCERVLFGDGEGCVGTVDDYSSSLSEVHLVENVGRRDEKYWLPGQPEEAYVCIRLDRVRRITKFRFQNRYSEEFEVAVRRTQREEWQVIVPIQPSGGHKDVKELDLMRKRVKARHVKVSLRGRKRSCYNTSLYWAELMGF